MGNNQLLKLCGAISIVCFLFFPVAGCGSITFTGIDLFNSNDMSTSIKLLLGLSMICALGIIFLKDKVQIFFSAIAGLALLIIAYFVTKSKIREGGNFGIEDAIKVKSGAYLSMLGFLASAIIAKAKNELLKNQSNNTDSKSDNN